MNENLLNPDVKEFLDKLNHPMREEIEALRRIILSSNPDLTENIKWNGPNYRINGQDCLTMKINPTNKIQLIFHRGAKVKAQPTMRLIEGDNRNLDWKANDRAVASFKSLAEIESNKQVLEEIITKWLVKVFVSDDK